jgi:Fe-S-cluster containining protein
MAGRERASIIDYSRPGEAAALDALRYDRALGRRFPSFADPVVTVTLHRSRPRWSESPLRAELRALYAEVDELLQGWSCHCSAGGPPDDETPPALCCRFDLTGREPHPTTVELAELRHAIRAAGIDLDGRRRLPLAGGGPCPLLSDAGRCRVYASRPFGCRTFFCRDAAPGGRLEGSRWPRDAIQRIGRRIADLSARFDPRDPHPRPLVRALAARTGDRG